jgi:hypothetical protein
MVIVVLLYFIHQGIIHFYKGPAVNFISATVLLGFYLWFILKVEKKELQKIPILSRFITTGDKT